MQQRKSGRRKSIMIVEKDRTQGEIDKRPNENKEKKETSQITGDNQEDKQKPIDEQNKKPMDENVADNKKKSGDENMVQEGMHDEKKDQKDEMKEEIQDGKEDQMKDQEKKMEEKMEKKMEEKMEKKMEEKSKDEQEMKHNIKNDMKHDMKDDMKNEQEMANKMKDEQETANKMKDAEKIKDEMQRENQEQVKDEKYEMKEAKKGLNADAHSKDQKQKVNFDEQKNESMAIEKDPAKSVPSPTEEELHRKREIVNEEIRTDNSTKSEIDQITGAIPIDQLKDTSELHLLKSNNKLIIEGDIQKRMFICSCFWHKRYFVLTVEGILCYFRKPNGKSSGHVHLRDELESIRRVNDQNQFKIFLKYKNGSVESLRFDEERVRDIWCEKMRSVMD